MRLAWDGEPAGTGYGAGCMEILHAGTMDDEPGTVDNEPGMGMVSRHQGQQA